MNHELIKSNATYLCELYNQWIPIYDYYNNSPIYFETKENNYHNFLDYFSHEKVVEYVRGCPYIRVHHGKNMTFVYFQQNSSRFDYEICRELVVISKTLQHISKCTHHIYILYVPIPIKRDFEYKKITNETIEKSNKEFKAFTVSGVTFGFQTRYSIITRYEEIHKLLIHELIHNLYLDYSNDQNNIEYIKIYNQLKPMGNYNYEFSMYETYTELMATYYNIIFILMKENTCNTNKIYKMIKMEILHSYIVLSNIIRLNGYKSYKDFDKKKVFCGDISFYEYYYVKALCYNQLDISTSHNSYIYQKIIYIHNDEWGLLKTIFNVCKKHKLIYNYKYIYFSYLKKCTYT